MYYLSHISVSQIVSLTLLKGVALKLKPHNKSLETASLPSLRFGYRFPLGTTEHVNISSLPCYFSLSVVFPRDPFQKNLLHPPCSILLLQYWFVDLNLQEAYFHVAIAWSTGSPPIYKTLPLRSIAPLNHPRTYWPKRDMCNVKVINE